MRVSPPGWSFPVKVNSNPLIAVSKIYGAFSYRDLPSTSGLQPRTIAIYYFGGSLGLPQPTTREEDFIKWSMALGWGNIVSSSGITSFKLRIYVHIHTYMCKIVYFLNAFQSILSLTYPSSFPFLQSSLPSLKPSSSFSSFPFHTTYMAFWFCLTGEP